MLFVYLKLYWKFSGPAQPSRTAEELLETSLSPECMLYKMRKHWTDEVWKGNYFDYGNY